MGNAWCGSANSWISTAFSRPQIGEFFFASGSATNKNSTNSFWLVEDGWNSLIFLKIQTKMLSSWFEIHHDIPIFFPPTKTKMTGWKIHHEGVDVSPIENGGFSWIFQPVTLHVSELRGICLAGLWHLSSIPGAIICDDAWNSTSYGVSLLISWGTRTHTHSQKRSLYSGFWLELPYILQ